MDVRLCRTCGTPVSASRPSARSLLTIMIHMHSVKDKCIIWIICHAKASCHSSESICHINYDCFPCSILYLLKTVKTRRNGLSPPFLAQVKQGLLVLPVPSKIIIKSLCLFFSFFFFSPSCISQEQKVDYYAVSRMRVDLFADHTDFLVVVMVVWGVSSSWQVLQCHRAVCSGSVSTGQFCQQVSP